MPNANTWGLLPKSLSDSQTIATYIASELATHNADDSAHGQSDEAIYNHRIGAIIDHLDESIKNSKVKIEHRFYHAIFDSAGGGDYDDLQDALDFVNSIGGGQILALDGTHIINRRIQLYSNISLEGQTRENTIFTGPKISYTTGTVSVVGDSYDTGKANFVNGSNIVTGSEGAAWLAQGFQNGDEIYDWDGWNFTIDHVIDDTHLQLTTNYNRTTNTDLYAISRITSASAIVTGIGTNWLSSGLSAGDTLQTLSEIYPLEILSVDSDTQITMKYTTSGYIRTETYTAWIHPSIQANLGVRRYKTGTVTVTENDATIIGSGTAFLANVVAGDSISIFDTLFTVLSVTNNTHLELTENWIGKTVSGLEYFCGPFFQNIKIKNLTFTGFDGNDGAINFNQIENIIFEFVTATKNYNALTAGYCNNLTVIHCDLSNNDISNARGLSAEGMANSNILFNNLNNNTWRGLESLDSRSGNNIIGNTANGNGSGGIELGVRGPGKTIGNNIAFNNCSGNASNGISLDSADYSIIEGNICNDNDYYGLIISVTGYATLIGNSCNNNLKSGIYLIGSIYTIGNILNANNCKSNLERGIYISTGSVKSVVVANVLLQNVTNLYDLGTLTEKGHNITV